MAYILFALSVCLVFIKELSSLRSHKATLQNSGIYLKTALTIIASAGLLNILNSSSSLESFASQAVGVLLALALNIFVPNQVLRSLLASGVVVLALATNISPEIVFPLVGGYSLAVLIFAATVGMGSTQKIGSDCILPMALMLGRTWITYQLGSAEGDAKMNILIGAAGIGLIINSVGAFIPPEYNARATTRLVTAALLGLASAGGLGVLSQAIAPEMNHWQACATFGLAIFFCNVITCEENESETKAGVSPKALLQLTMVALLGFIAGRTLGSYGWLLLALGAGASRGNLSVAAAGLFWICRIAIQLFVGLNVSNVTGVNLLHLYVGAGLFGGVLIVLTLGGSFASMSPHRDVVGKLIPIVALVAPAAAGYFLHGEASASLAFSMSIAALVFVFLNRHGASSSAGGGNLIALLSAYMCFAMINCESFLQAGEVSSKLAKMIVLSVAVLISAILYFVWHRVLDCSKSKSSTAPMD